MANTLAVKSHSAKAQDRVIRVIIYVLLIVMAALMLVPFLWMLSASFKMNKDVFAFLIEWIPSNPRVRNYVDIWTKIPLLTFIFNTAKLTIIVTLLQLFTSSFAAYAFAKLNFKGKKTLPEIIQDHKQSHAHQHRAILLDGCAGICQQPGNCRFRNTVSHQITDGNVHNKFQHCFPASALVLEREMLVQEVAQDTSKYIIGCRRYPVTEMQQIIKRKHHRRSKQRIYNSNHDKFPEGLIKYFLQFFHLSCPFRRFPTLHTAAVP